MFLFGLRPSTIDSMSEGSLSRVWVMPAIAPTAQNRRRTLGVGSQVMLPIPGLKTAKTLDLIFPTSLLAIADEVSE